MFRVHNSPFTRRRLLGMIGTWIMSIPILVWGGSQPAFLPRWEFPRGAVIFFLIVTALETLWLYWGLSSPRAWYKSLAKGLFIVWGLGWFTISLVALDIGELPMAHGLWLLLAFAVNSILIKW